MDKTAAIKLLAGTLARGIMWAAAAAAAKWGFDAMSESTAEGLAFFVAGAVVAGISAVWSAKKDQKLLDTPPPK